jgi:hypothetical protein
VAFKDEIESMCKQAIDEERDVLVRLPRAPQGWTKHKIAERYFQLEQLIKRNGCKISKVNLTDYKIYKDPNFKAPEEH